MHQITLVIDQKWKFAWNLAEQFQDGISLPEWSHHLVYQFQPTIYDTLE